MIRRFLAATLLLTGLFVLSLFLLPAPEAPPGPDAIGQEVPLAQSDAAFPESAPASERTTQRLQARLATLFAPQSAHAHHRESCSYSASPGGAYVGCFGMAHVVVHLYDKDTGQHLGTQDEGCWGCGGAKSLTVGYEGYESCDLTIVPNSSFNGRNLDVHTYLVPNPPPTATPEPTPTPRPTPTQPPGDQCPEGRFIREIPPQLTWNYRPNFPVAYGQDPARRGLDLRVNAQGGLVELVEKGWRQTCPDGKGLYPRDCPDSDWSWVCHEDILERQDDPIVRIDATMALAPSSVAWIEGLGSRYPGARRQEALPALFTLWKGRSMSVQTGLYEYEASDPGLHEGEIKLYTAGTAINNFKGQQVKVPYRVPVHLLDTTLDAPLVAPPPGGTPPPAVTPAPGVTPVGGGGTPVPPPFPGPIATPRPEDR